MGAYGREKISVLIASRGRPGRLAATLERLKATAAYQSSYEVLVRVDDDDDAVYDMPGIEALYRGPRGRGYVDLHVFYNELAGIARGQWLLMFGDDAEMLTPRWDAKILDAEKRTVLDCGPEAAPWEFPCVHDSLISVVGHVSLNAHYDTWWYELSRSCGIYRDVGVRVRHRADSVINDTKVFDSDAMKDARKVDIAKLKAYLSGVK